MNLCFLQKFKYTFFTFFLCRFFLDWQQFSFVMFGANFLLDLNMVQIFYLIQVLLEFFIPYFYAIFQVFHVSHNFCVQMSFHVLILSRICLSLSYLYVAFEYVLWYEFLFYRFCFNGNCLSYLSLLLFLCFCMLNASNLS